ncbi:hypothetical protein [Pseudoalteromonas denitrificans]|uniref:YdhG-like domain-containing protein n=1 Tax=Pseudoalteromonas denitrificans DSM 6059 TaxID=1123010 RepID=A0A1I1NLL1_9GAMM|nr:hypothetical protein [Pseudoalteromonas denitrificans]SFC94640.1 hypothetical protein SAMN02745724_03007 [Pseudoalteromonas denitrificans DSM 6059]
MDITVLEKFNAYPEEVKLKLNFIRSLIFDIAQEFELGEVTESLKWGEPSLNVKNGSAVRIDWKANEPEQYVIYFNCKTKLVDTFKTLYTDGSLNFENNRSIVFLLSDLIPLVQVKHCISLSLRYHSIKNLPLLGA